MTKASRAILAGGLLAGALDITAAFVFYRRNGPVRLLQGIARGLIGERAFQYGAATAALGLALHFVIALGAAAVYYAASRKLKMLVRQPIICGLLFGIAVYWFMNLIVLPLSAIHRKISFQFSSDVALGLAIHMLCVGLPIALAVRRYSK